jgi:hypothetical protein
LIITLAGLLAGCQFAEPAPAVIQPEVIWVQVTPSARPTTAALQACAAQMDGVVVRIEERYPAAAEPGLLVRLGEPDGDMFMARIAEERLGAVLHPDNPAASPTTDEIRDLFSGRTPNWEILGGEDMPVKVWVLPETDESMQALETEVLEGLLPASDAGLAPDPAAMGEAVSADPAAIGLFPAAWPHDDLTLILLGVHLPVLVTAPSTPTGPEAELIACLQGETGQAALGLMYP